MKKPIKFDRQGFTLVVTLALMILLTVIAVGSLTLSSVSLRASSQGESIAVARANARLALMLAIGDLQLSLGPDRAVTANESILSASPGKPNTAGVCESWDYNPNSTSLDYVGEESGRFRRWLVSTPIPSDSQKLDFAKAGWSGSTVELVGAGSLGGGTVDSSQKALAGLIPLERNGKVQGRLAYHVADESLKARINLYRDPSKNTTFAQKRALLSGHRPHASSIKGIDGNLLNFLPSDETPALFDKANEDSVKVTSINQISLFGNNAKIAPFRNDVTPYSLGLLSNARLGGLKKDLTSLFEMSVSPESITLPSEFLNKKLYQTTHNITGVSDPNWTTLAGCCNVFKAITTPESSPMFYRRPSTGVSLAPSVPTRFYPGPVIAKVESLFTYVTRDAYGGWPGILGAVDPKLNFMGHLVYTPLVTLHNPYNVNLQSESMEVTIRNMPVAFNFYVNGVAQSTRLVPLTDMFVNERDRREKMFVLKIANWSSPTSDSTSGQIVMKPGQTLVCAPYVDPNLTFDKGSHAFFDWITPMHGGYDTGSQSDGPNGVLGLRDTDSVSIEYGVAKPTFGLNTEFQVQAKLTAFGRQYDFGGLQFIYQDDATLKKYFPSNFRYPLRNSMRHAVTYVSNSTPLKSHANAQTVAVFSAYARTTGGGVYETNKRTATAGAVNALRDGRLAGKPFLHHNTARPVVSTNLQSEKPGNQSHELNFQPFINLGQVEDYFTLDSTNRTPYLTGNTTSRGIKSGSYLDLPTGPMQTIADVRRSNALTSSDLPSFVQPVGNSLSSPLMATDKVIQTDSTVATRGPFLSMSEFVNRRIGSNSERTRMGALEAALEKANINSTMFATQVPITDVDVSDANLYNYKTVQAATGNPAAGAPGWISQGGLMRILEPSATVRSDTFVIRAYGEALDASGKNVLAKAWAEAVIQRIPDYVDSEDRTSMNAATDVGASSVKEPLVVVLRLFHFAG